MSLLSKKKVVLKDETLTNKISLKLDKDLVIDDATPIDAILTDVIKMVVPNVVGMSIKDAVNLLTSKNIKYRLIGKEVIPKEGSVYKQFPVAGEKIGLKEELQVYVDNKVYAVK